MRLFSRRFTPVNFPPVMNIVDSRVLPFLERDFSEVFQPPADLRYIGVTKTIEKVMKEVENEDFMKEYCFLGKSNVGKSSLLNELIG
jgi:tRNA U34 5-carboxymethylaminomethyl modifying GTPase MnmE/TrmE